MRWSSAKFTGWACSTSRPSPIVGHVAGGQHAGHVLLAAPRSPASVDLARPARSCAAAPPAKQAMTWSTRTLAIFCAACTAVRIARSVSAMRVDLAEAHAARAGGGGADHAERATARPASRRRRRRGSARGRRSAAPGRRSWRCRRRGSRSRRAASRPCACSASPAGTGRDRSWAARLLARWHGFRGARPAAASAQPQRRAARVAHVDDRDVARQQVLRLVERDHPLQRGDRVGLGQQDALVAVQHHVPAPLADAHQAAQARRAAARRRRPAPAPRAPRRRRPVARDQRQVGAVGARGQRRRPGGRSASSSSSPSRVRQISDRHPLGHAHLQHAAGAHRTCGVGAPRRAPSTRCAASPSRSRSKEDIGKRSGQPRADRLRDRVGEAPSTAIMLDHEFRPLLDRAGAALTPGRSAPRGGRRRRSQRPSTADDQRQRQAEPQRRARKNGVSHSRLQPVGQPRRRGIGVGAAAQRSHEASSTIQRQSAPKGMPAWAACSGASEVGVMPGWVLVSSRISPSRPRASSQRKSVRLTPRQPSAAVGAQRVVEAGVGRSRPASRRAPRGASRRACTWRRSRTSRR